MALRKTEIARWQVQRTENLNTRVKDAEQDREISNPEGEKRPVDLDFPHVDDPFPALRPITKRASQTTLQNLGNTAGGVEAVGVIFA